MKTTAGARGADRARLSAYQRKKQARAKVRVAPKLKLTLKRKVKRKLGPWGCLARALGVWRRMVAGVGEVKGSKSKLNASRVKGMAKGSVAGSRQPGLTSAEALVRFRAKAIGCPPGIGPRLLRGVHAKVA